MLNGHGTAVERSVVDAPPLHPLHRESQLLQLGLLLLILLHLQIKAGLFFIHVEGVVAGIEFSVTLCDFNHPLRHLIQKVTVMGNGQHRTLKPMDIAFQPFHTIQIQMVCRLVQQQDIGFFQQQTRQIHPGFLTPGKAVKRLQPLFPRNAQTVADLIRFHIHVVSAPGLEAVGQIIVLRQLLFRRALQHGFFQFFHPCPELQQRRKGRTKNIRNRVALRETGNLGD